MKKRILSLMEKDGFIIFLFVCVFMVAIGTVFVSTRDLTGSKDNKEENELVIIEDDMATQSANVEEDIDQIKEEVSEEVVENEEVREEVVENEEDVVEVAVINTEEKEAPVEDSDFVKENNKTFILPIDGSIITEFTKDTLIYSETLETWTGHSGIDISAKEGTIVKAAMDGTVKEVFEDKLWGTVIIIDHGNGYETKYANLAIKDMVKVGTKVKKGDSISKVGKTASIEMMMEPHLHFEVIKDGKNIDPRSINK